jgi:hypothetical protein
MLSVKTLHSHVLFVGLKRLRLALATISTAILVFGLALPQTSNTTISEMLMSSTGILAQA